MHFTIQNIKEDLENNLDKIKNATLTVRIIDPTATVEKIEELVQHCQDTKAFMIQDAKIKTLPNLSQLTKLTRLNINCPNIESIPEKNFPPNIFELTITNGNMENLPEHIWQLYGLRYIRFKDEKLEKLFIPSGSEVQNLFLNLPKLNSLKCGSGEVNINIIEIITNSSLELDESLSNLEMLSTLKITGPVNKVSCDFSNMKLSKLQCKNWNLKDYDFLKTIKDLTHLEISNSSTGWTNFPDLKIWPNLYQVAIADNLDAELRNSGMGASKLFFINIKKSSMVFNPEILKNCSKLHAVYLQDLPPVDFADFIKHLAHIRVVSIGETTLENINDIPPNNTANWVNLTLNQNNNSFQNLDFLDALPKLNIFRNWDNPLSSPLVFLRKKTVPIEGFNQSFPNPKFKKAKQFCSFCSAVENSGLPEEDKAFFVNYMFGQKTLSTDKRWDWTTVLKATNISLLSFRKKVKTLIDEKISNNKNANPLNSESIIYISGKPKAKITALKKQIKELGCKIVSKYSEEVTHVIIGMSSPDYNTLKEKEYTPLTANDLQRTFADTQPQFLKEKLNNEDDSDLVENLTRLLQSPEPLNVNVGLEMIKNGGMPSPIFEPLMVLHKTTTDNKIRKAVGEVLEIHAPPEWKSLVRDRLSFKIVDNPRRNEVEIRKQFRAISKRTSPTIAGKFSCMMFRQKGRGLRYALTARLKKELKIEAYQLLLKDHHFDFSKGLSFNERPKNTYGYDYYDLPQSSVKLPELALELDTIQSLDLTNCRYNNLSEEITKFKDLKHLNLAINELTNLTDYFAELKNLETIDFSHNFFKSFPTILSQLPKLKKIDFRKNYEFEIPDSFKKSHPDCEILLEPIEEKKV